MAQSCILSCGCAAQEVHMKPCLLHSEASYRSSPFEALIKAVLLYRRLLDLSLTMPFAPVLTTFCSFRDLDPSVGNQCIYFTQKGARCRNTCSRGHSEASKLRSSILANTGETERRELLLQYILLKCCTQWHRAKIQDAGLLYPLAKRWQDEISRDSYLQTPVYVALSTPVSTLPFNTPPTMPPHCWRNSGPKPINITQTLPCPAPATSPNRDREKLWHQPRYNLRSRQVPFVSPRSLESEFVPHKPNSLPADSVSSRLRAYLGRRDKERGSIYIFDRSSSPGHVKIGWTAVSVSGRLADWRKCGYNPNLLYRADGVPHAQRVETLVHHELIKEWRRERMCAGCGKRHQEWFEISKQRAADVLFSWVEVMRITQPYDRWGRLQSPVKDIVETMDKSGELITGKRVLDCIRALTSQILAVDQSFVSSMTNIAPPTRQEVFRRQSLLPIDNSSIATSSPATTTAMRSETARSNVETTPSHTAIVEREALDDKVAPPSRESQALKLDQRTAPTTKETGLDFHLATFERVIKMLINRHCSGLPALNVGVPGMEIALQKKVTQPRTVIARAWLRNAVQTFLDLSMHVA